MVGLRRVDGVPGTLLLFTNDTSPKFHELRATGKYEALTPDPGHAVDATGRREDGRAVVEEAGDVPALRLLLRLSWTAKQQSFQ